MVSRVVKFCLSATLIIKMSISSRSISFPCRFTQRSDNKEISFILSAVNLIPAFLLCARFLKLIPHLHVCLSLFGLLLVAIVRCKSKCCVLYTKRRTFSVEDVDEGSRRHTKETRFGVDWKLRGLLLDHSST